MNDHTVSRQWANRPDDERFLTLDALHDRVKARAENSIARVSISNQLRAVPVEGLNDIRLEDANGDYSLTNWSFGQLSQAAQAPASYLRKLPAPLAAMNLNYGLHTSQRENQMLYISSNNGDGLQTRALTSESYGRIYDHKVVEAVMKVNEQCGGRWVVPAASYSTQNPKRATTLYGSDRDVFVFLVDDKNPVEIPGETHPLFRGFYVWNSEVGAQVFGLKTFLYRTVCDNRIIWDMSNVTELRIRHTSGAPDRFRYEGKNALRKYAESSTAEIVETVKKAKAFELPANTPTANSFDDWFRKNGFTASMQKEVVETAKSEEGQATTLWDICNGLTAVARRKTHTDSRIDLEQKAGKLLQSIK